MNDLIVSYDKMIKTLAFLLLCASASANVLTFTGKIDSVPNGTNLFHVGDPVMFKLTFNPVTMIITRAGVSSGESDFVLYGTQGRVYFDIIAEHGSVYWQAIDSDNFQVNLGTSTPNGVVPCIGDFDVNDFTITLGANVCAPRFTVHGHLTSIP